MAGVALYSAVGDTITHYDVDVDAATLSKRATIRVPAKVQYAWPHPSRSHLYVTTSSGGPRMRSDFNHVSAYTIGPDGALSAHGGPRSLDRRAVHMCVDPSGRFILSGHNFPASGITLHRIEQDGTIGAPVAHSETLDFGIYPHQVMVFPSGSPALIVDRGNQAKEERAEEPGALRSFEFVDGKLSPGEVVAPRGGYGFGPRHVDFHPLKPWLYASDERTNRVYQFRFADGAIEAEPACSLDTLAEPLRANPRQLGGPIHVHPTGRWIYVANRSDHTVDFAGQKVFGGGENNIAVFRIDPDSGNLEPIQHADTRSFHVRTFACDPSGRLLVAASIKPLAVRRGDDVDVTPAALSVFRILADGRLEFVRKYDVDTPNGQLQYWMGIVGVR
ncbi:MULTISPECIES: beta-propeller fold lactonase family protein [unclassified Burkholderia]|uniref:lactonase family protein n=1 Tax=unclassified Burkholderia TaxID=2613784 RepID=UPI000F58F6E3|nr:MULTISPECIES: beta-propeller fold lactonase family protein [unclassified Burkholderia]RQS24843.1 3-carboxymuconate cyclase [Burkholderia sp. Bp8995]RQS43230.1 3-carboxymuconate cyclase [Burkholderia sp. Bp8989]